MRDPVSRMTALVNEVLLMPRIVMCLNPQPMRPVRPHMPVLQRGVVSCSGHDLRRGNDLSNTRRVQGEAGMPGRASWAGDDPSIDPAGVVGPFLPGVETIGRGCSLHHRGRSLHRASGRCSTLCFP